jgi:SAM-dependent methyltransferase
MRMIRNNLRRPLGLLMKLWSRARWRRGNRDNTTGDRSAAGQVAEEAAIQEAWVAYRLNPSDRASKVRLAHLLRRFPTIIDAGKRLDLLQLIRDPEIDPDYISLAGWFLILNEGLWKSATKNEDWDMLAAYLDDNELALSLLKETPVYLRDVERGLTEVRRWLLFSGQYERYRRFLDALVIQATLNGGAWPFDDAERALVDQTSGLPIVHAYLPISDGVLTSAPVPDAVLTSPTSQDAVTRAVTAGYERWPYPTWQRVTVPNAGVRLPDEVRALDPGGPDCLPVDAKILIAGCGTGKEAAQTALKYPDATVIAIDVSEASLSYAYRQCAGLGIQNIRFLNLDLHNVSELNDNFDAIFCSGVLHHLPGPERGWAALVAVLRPGAVMRISLYSRIARERTGFTAALALIRDLAPGPVNDDIVRRVRRYLMDQHDSAIARSIVNSRDFGTLAGTRDLLLHPQVDPFDFPRISRALERFGLRLLSVILPIDVRARYDQIFPNDPMHRDVESLAKFEESEPRTFRAMYDFWSRRSDCS